MIKVESITNQIINADCMDILKQLPDKCIDLVLTDPPYGINVCKMTLGNGRNKIYRGKENWDIAPPSDKVFSEIFRVSKNQIIWGGNYFAKGFSNSMCWLVWDKGTGENDFADCELAWTSFNSAVRKYFKSWVGANAKDTIERLHPTQKPLVLFEWCLRKFSNENDLVLDCFSGSGTTAIACHNLKRRFICIEKDKDYWQASVERLKNAQAQLKLF
jgi:site-specific DNA-methyltransferase (adenine-specific)